MRGRCSRGRILLAAVRVVFRVRFRLLQGGSGFGRGRLRSEPPLLHRVVLRRVVLSGQGALRVGRLCADGCFWVHRVPGLLEGVLRWEP